MTRPVDPELVRNLADRIELLPNLINDPRHMPFVQGTLRVALERYRSDREVQALGREILGDPGEAEEYRQPMACVQLLDDERRAIEEGFKQDETGVFEQIERDAAEIGELLKERRHPRDAERFRESLKFLRSDMVVWPVLGVEVRPGVHKLDLSIWEAMVAKPICNYLRSLADDLAKEPPPVLFSGKGVSLRDAAERIRPNDPDGQTELIKNWRNSRCPKLPVPLGKCPHHSQANLYGPASFLSFLKQVEGQEVDRDFGLSAHFRKVSRFPRPAG